MSAPPPPGPPPSLLLPLLAGVVYVLGAMSLKRAADLGSDPWRAVRLCNLASAVVFAPLALLGGTLPSWQLCWQPAVIGLLFMAGQACSLLALDVGDVSVATPVLGVKVVLVALLTPALLGEAVGGGLWTAAGLSSAAIVLLHAGAAPAHRIGATAGLAGLAAAAYAMVDVLVQKWAPAWGAGRLLPLTMAFVAVGSLPLAAAARTPATPAPARGWVAGGAMCLAVQGLMIGSSIALYGQAAVANVLYSSRGLWSVLAVWIVGHWFASRERHLGGRVLAWRLLGALLLMAAISLVLLGPARASAGGHGA